MKTKHTPGPWQVLPEECDKPYVRVRGTVPGTRYKVANVITPIYDGVPAQEASETRANARLIAAAPELLVVLTDARKFIFSTAPHGGLLERVDAAIAKATGGQS